MHTVSIYPSNFATSSYPSSTTLSLGSQTVMHSPHTLAQSSPTDLSLFATLYSHPLLCPPMTQALLYCQSVTLFHANIQTLFLLVITPLLKLPHHFLHGIYSPIHFLFRSHNRSIICKQLLPKPYFFRLTPIPLPCTCTRKRTSWYPSPFDPHLRFPGSRPSLLRLSQYRLVVDIEQDRGGRAVFSQSPSQATKQNSYPPYHAPCTPSFHANQSASLTFSLSVHTFQATFHSAGLLTHGYAFSKSSNPQTILSFSSLASPPVLPTLFA